MIKFRTEIPIPEYPFKIGYEHNTLFMGSCFSDHAGNLFLRYSLPVSSNPFGILFNPASIANALKLALNPLLFNDHYIDFFDNQWISFAHHGKFSAPEKSVFLQNIENQLQECGSFLRKSHFIFITLGTAYCYYHKAKGLIVSNCHKIPAREFEKIRLEVEQVTANFDFFFEWIKKEKPDLKVIFTVSPVRHLSDGFHENQLSKSILHLAVDKMADNQTVFYFPAYEILQDDLRDYRFYAKDLCHPGENAVEYIEDIFKESFFTDKTKDKIKMLDKDNKRNSHIVIKKL